MSIFRDTLSLKQDSDYTATGHICQVKKDTGIKNNSLSRKTLHPRKLPYGKARASWVAKKIQAVLQKKHASAVAKKWECC